MGLIDENTPGFPGYFGYWEPYPTDSDDFWSSWEFESRLCNTSVA